MEVTFTKLAGDRYTMTVVRERGPALASRLGPGFDDHLPHDAVHLMVEIEAGLTGGMFGRVAAGQSNIFSTADPAAGCHQRRKEAKRRFTREERADMARSELLASVCPPIWELRTGRRKELPLWFSSVVPDVLVSPLVERIVERLDDFAARWHQLPTGGRITIPWSPPRRAGYKSTSGTAGRSR